MPKEYSIAISYAGAHRTLVHTIANLLNSALTRLEGTVFLDLYDRIEFVGKVDEELEAVYREKCDIAVVFESREYFQSKWCQKEWQILREFMLHGGENAPRVLLFSLDRFEGEHIPGYVAKDAQPLKAEEIARIILEKMNVSPWVADARYALRVLTAMKGDRADWKLEHTIRDSATGAVYVGSSGDSWIPDSLADLCRGRNLTWTKGTARLPKGIVCLCGPKGAGKSVLLLRAIASAGKHEVFPDHSWMVDFSNNKKVCADSSQLEKIPAGELKRFLCNQTVHHSNFRHLFLAIDGLDSAARYLSVHTDEMTASRMTMRALHALTGTLGEWSRDRAEPLTITLVVALNAPRSSDRDCTSESKPEVGTWDWMYRQLEKAGAVIVNLDELPPVDERSFDTIYDSKLKLRAGDYESAARYVADDRDFLRLPLFLDGASWLLPAELDDSKSRADFLLKAQRNGRVSAWPNELDDVLEDLVRFIGAIPFGFASDAWLRTMVRREWTGAWMDLLTEAMMSQALSGGMQDLLKLLLQERSRWDLSASYALSNVITALCEAGKAPRLEAEIRYYNLRRATLDKTVFGPQSILFGVDCTGSSLKHVRFEDGCKFIATDFTMCTWDLKPMGDAKAFIECSGL